MKEEPKDVKPAPGGSDVLRGASRAADEAHDGDFPVISWAFVESAMEIKEECPGLLETIATST